MSCTEGEREAHWVLFGSHSRKCDTFWSARRPDLPRCWKVERQACTKRQIHDRNDQNRVACAGLRPPSSHEERLRDWSGCFQVLRACRSCLLCARPSAGWTRAPEQIVPAGNDVWSRAANTRALSAAPVGVAVAAGGVEGICRLARKGHAGTTLATVSTISGS